MSNLNFLIVLLSPIAALIFLPLKRTYRRLFYIISLVFASLSIWCSFTVELFKYSIPFVGLEIMVDGYTRIFLVLVCCTWFIAIIYSYAFTKYHFQEKRVRFFFFLNTLLTMATVTACSGDLITLFISYSVGIPLTYPLLVIRDNQNAYSAAKIFVMQTALPSLFIFLPAIVLTNIFFGNLSFSTATTTSSAINPMIGGLILAMFVIGISKNSVFPFHTWLPGLSSAPAPVSGLIHSVATVKTGSIALIKIAVYIFGLPYINELTSQFLTGGWLTYLVGLTAVYTAYLALKSDDLKTRFGYSTVGQLSYIILAILVGTRLSVLAALLHIITHAIAKSCLFYVAGFYNSVYRTTSVRAIAKIMPHTRGIAVIIAICGLSITGFPYLAGFYSKDLMLVEEWNAHYYSSAIFLAMGSIVNVLYIIGPVKSALNKPDPAFVLQPVPHSMMIAFVLSTALIIGSNFYVPYIIQILM